jgi:hypothetical protein
MQFNCPEADTATRFDKNVKDELEPPSLKTLTFLYFNYNRLQINN